MQTIYIDDFDPLLQYTNISSKMDLIDNYDIYHIYPGFNLDIKSNGINTETNFSIKKTNENTKKTINTKDIENTNSNNKNTNKKITTKTNNSCRKNNKVIKRKALSKAEQRKRNTMAALKYRNKKKAEFQNNLNLIASLKQEIEKATVEIKNLNNEIAFLKSNNH